VRRGMAYLKFERRGEEEEELVKYHAVFPIG
jgi:hypothetical protein